jgi:hypothetical protein
VGPLAARGAVDSRLSCPVLHRSITALAMTLARAAGPILSLGIIRVATALRRSVTCRLFARRAAILAAALFVRLTGSQFLGALATCGALVPPPSRDGPGRQPGCLLGRYRDQAEGVSAISVGAARSRTASSRFRAGNAGAPGASVRRRMMHNATGETVVARAPR